MMVELNGGTGSAIANQLPEEMSDYGEHRSLAERLFLNVASLPRPSPFLVEAICILALEA